MEILNVVYKDRDIILLDKPIGMPCQSDPSGEQDLFSMIKPKKGRTPGLIHRLDKPVGGLMVFSLHRKATASLSEEIREHRIKKKYLAVICGQLDEPQGRLTHHLKKMKTLNMSKVVDESVSGGKEAVLNYTVLETITSTTEGFLSLVEIELITGRHHQIRLQFSAIRNPLWGDHKYHKRFRTKQADPQVALWSYYLGFKHPGTQNFVEYSLNKNSNFPFSLFENRISKL